LLLARTIIVGFVLSGLGLVLLECSLGGRWCIMGVLGGRVQQGGEGRLGVVVRGGRGDDESDLVVLRWYAWYGKIAGWKRGCLNICM
jgi:hypothetical protein